MDPISARPSHQAELLRKLLHSSFAGLDEATLEILHGKLEWMELAGGQTLMRQGEPGDSMYISLSGRLRAYVSDAAGTMHRVREMARGQVVGEMALYTGEPRSATVVAIRDSVLARLDKHSFDELVQSSPQVSAALARQMIARMQRPLQGAPLERPVSIGLLPISEGVDAASLARDLALHLAPLGRVNVVDAASIDDALGEPGLARAADGDAGSSRRVALLLDRIEAESDFLLLVGDPEPTAWSGRCSRHCDELLLLADARAEPVLHANELQFLSQRSTQSEAAEIIVLLHEADAGTPRHTAAWLARRPVGGHVHIRPHLAADMARLARLQSRTAVGLVLSGGGARGFAHLGTLRALQEAGVVVDCVGGTSIGAVMATFIASDQPLARVMEIARRCFGGNPTGDLNLYPVLSLVSGRRLRRVTEVAVQDLLGGPANLEDLWKGFYCVASNYSRACEVVVERGALIKSLLASTAIPGALPPVLHEGELLCDGGAFNNFPVDVMRRMRGVGTVIGVDLAQERAGTIDLQELPGPWALIFDRLRLPSRRRYHLPSLTAYLMNVTTLYSQSRRAQARTLCDLYINHALQRVGMLEWKRFDSIEQQAFEHARRVLQDTPAPLMARLRGATRPA